MPQCGSACGGRISHRDCDIIYYAPTLAVFGVATGAVTGMIFKAVIPALEKQKNHFLKKKEE